MSANDLDARRARLSPAKLAMLERRLRRHAEAATSQRIPPCPRVEPLPLSFAQERLWLLDQLEPASHFYNLAVKRSFVGHFAPAALERALTELIGRHETLRTTLALSDGQPVQIIADVKPATIPFFDLTGLPEDERLREAHRMMGEDLNQPFDLSTGPLLRARLMRMVPEEHLLLVVMHHIISDGWSLSIFERELCALYEAYSQGKQPDLPPLPIQYADYAVWQRRYLTGAKLEEQIAYWRQQLDGIPAVLDLPFARPRPAVQNYRGAVVSFALTPRLGSRLKELSQREGVTLFMTLLAVFKSLLYRYCGQEDIVVGTLIAGRNYSEVEPLIGFFLNNLVLRTKLTGAETFLQVIQRVREVCLSAYKYQELPFEKLVEELQPERSLNYNPLFQVLFKTDDVPGQATPPSLQSLRVGEANQHDGETAKFDLMISILDRPEALYLSINYSTDLFSAETIEALGRHYEKLLESAAAHPEQKITEPSLITDKERRQLSRWNETQVDFPKGESFPALFAAQVKRRPNEVAVTFENEELTYRQLNERANRLAAMLIEQGVKAETIVALLTARDVRMLVAILAIFKAGGAYLPIDPRSPARRMSQLCAASNFQFLLVAEEFKPGLAEALAGIPVDHQPTVLGIEDLEAQALARQAPAADPETRSTPENLAYVIYTSGSSGPPKGAMIVHAGMINHLYAKIRDLALQASDVVAQTASQAFDISVWQCLAPLLIGARVQIVPDEIAHSVGLLLKAVDERVTILEVVPSLLREMLAEMEGRPPAAQVSRNALRWLVVTGEAFAGDLSRHCQRLFPSAQVMNAYGPTECSDDVTHYVLGAAELGAQVPIGRPIANITAHVLDESLRPVPIGVKGELFIGGTGVGRGYLHAPARTAESFLPNPFSGVPGARLYRTGDIVRFLPDGLIEFLGRRDHQIKVRGFRIELGEIEAALSEHPAIKECVIDCQDVDTGKLLVAYVVPQRMNGSISGKKLRTFLKDRLPEYMVPASYISIPKLPLTPNGKVDRKALQNADQRFDFSAGDGRYLALGEIFSGDWTLDLYASGDEQVDLGASESSELPATLSHALNELGRREEKSLSVTLLAALQILLARYSGQTEVRMNVASARVEEALVPAGFFATGEKLSVDLAGNPTFRGLLKQLEAGLWAVLAEADSPFDQPADSLLTGSNQVSLLAKLRLKGSAFVRLAALQPRVGPESSERWDLWLSIVESGQRLKFTINYNPTFIDGATVGRVAEHFKILLASIATSTELHIWELMMLGEAERRQLAAWNQTAQPYPQEVCVHELFEAQAVLTPDSVAVSFQEEQISYRELNERANRLAHHLRARGGEPETRVGLCIERSIEMIVGLLAILKAGAAYVPLDPEYPSERLAFMVADAGIELLLTQAGTREQLPMPAEMVICVDADAAQWAGQSTENPASGLHPDNLAYVMYTSGSTGVPKGVMITHRALVNHTCSAIAAYGLSTSDRLLQFASLSINTSAEEIYPTLSCGATLVLRRGRLVQEPLRFLSECADAGITVLDLPTAYWHELASELLMAEIALPESIRLVIVGGEKLQREATGEWLPERVKLVNSYGPAETTIVATRYEVNRREAGSDIEIPIGKAIANVQLYVLDREMQLVPVGVAGELYIGGVGVARGYWRRADLTAERFVPNPYGERGGERLYRTGDVCRYRSDGELEFHGRADQQVKVRGQRVELGEVEAALKAAGDVKVAAVVASDEDGNDKRLIGYVVLEAESKVTAAELRARVEARLPAYMVPSAIVIMAELPLTANLKVDRWALPLSRPDLGPADETYFEARTAVEEILAGIWREILKVERVGVYDNFFELGGHSLLATRLISQVRRTFSIELPLRVVFETLNLAELAAEIVVIWKERRGLVAPPIVRVSGEGPFPLSYAQQGLWFYDQLEPGNPMYTISMPRRLHGTLNVEALERGFCEMLRRHENLRTTFPIVNGQPVQQIARSSEFRLRMVDLTDVAEEQREERAHALAEAERVRPFNLVEGPLMRASLFKLGDADYVLVLTMHHIISDAWSMAIFHGELSKLYKAYSEGQESPLPEPQFQYVDYAVWERDWLQGKVLEQHMDYWRRQLAGVPAVELPTDRPRTIDRTFGGEFVRFDLPKDLSDELKALSRREGVTLFMLLLTAFKLLLHRYSGQQEIVVGSPIAGRNRIEVEGLIGFFINTLAIHTSVKPHLTFRELLHQVRELCLDAYAHQEISFEKIVEELHPERNLAYNPLLQVVFQLTTAPRQRLALKGISMGGFEHTGGATVKWDLYLLLNETRQGLNGAFSYSSELFDAETIQGMLAHFEQLLKNIVASPESRISDLELLTEDERHRLLVDWNHTGHQFASAECAQQLFEAQVKRAPQMTALVFGQQRMSYGELDRRANQLAHYLQKRGVGTETIVGVALERTPEMIIAILGVLKAGGAYLPLDTSYPPERLALMIEDARPTLVITQTGWAEKLAGRDVRLLLLDEEKELIEKQKTETPRSDAGPQNLAYVIYTSGSTGRPKGVMLEHGGLCNLALAQGEAFGVTSESRVLQFASLSFDASVSEIFVTLATGATLYLARPEELMPGREFCDLMKRQSITHVTLPPSVLVALAHTELPALQTLVSAGEACPPPVAELWGRERRFINAYGPTEGTVCTTLTGAGPLDGGSGRIPIGKPLSNVEVYLLDKEQRLVPAGVAGELYLGGLGVARGYLGQGGLTAERFVPHPWSKTGGERLYRTGDLCRYRRNGELEYLGRADEQVKLRGYRIELGEVESVLNRHEDVQQSAVVLRQAENGEQQLVAYVVGTKEEGERRLELWPSVAEFFIYDEALYYAMTHDDRRNDSYRQAIAAAVKDQIVVDIGTGPEAILSRMCEAAGARHVYAIELLHETAERARQKIKREGLEDRITVVEGDARQVHLPEQADVCVSEIVGPVGGAEGAALILSDVRRRLLKPGGVMIPRRSVTQIAGMSLPEEFIAAPGFSEITRPYVERIFAEVGYRFDLRLSLKGLKTEDLITSRGVFEDLEFNKENGLAGDYRREIRLEVERAGRIDGLLVWLQLETGPAVPVLDILEHQHSWLPVYLPVFYPGVEVQVGDRLEAVVIGKLSENQLNPDYEIIGLLIRGNGQMEEFSYQSMHHGRGYRQNPFYEELFAGDEIKVRDEGQNSRLRQRLHQHLERYLPAYMLPSEYVTLSSMPLTVSGKIDRQALPAPSGVITAAEGNYIAPDNIFELTLQQIWESLLGARPISVTDDFFELGGHSLLAVTLMTKIEERFGQPLQLSSLFKGATIRSLAEVIRDYSSQGHWSPLFEFQKGVGKRPFFSVHGIGGNIINFFDLARHLDPDRGFYGLQATDSRSYKDQYGTLEEMAADYITEMRQVQPEGPYILGGYSFGGIIAFEIAQQLYRAGQEVAMLVAMDVRAPIPGLDPEVVDADSVEHNLMTLADTLGLPMEPFAEIDIMQLEPEKRLEYIWQVANSVDGGPTKLSLRQVKKMYERLSIHVRLVEKYQAKHYPGRLTLFRVQDQNGPEWLGPTLGWDQLVDGGLEVRYVPGDHVTMLSIPHVEVLAQELRQSLERLDGNEQSCRVTTAATTLH